MLIPSAEKLSLCDYNISNHDLVNLDLSRLFEGFIQEPISFVFCVVLNTLQEIGSFFM